MDFQKQIAGIITEGLSRARIKKKDLAAAIRTSNVYVTRFTKNPGSLPSPRKVRKIIMTLRQYGQDIERKVETAINECDSDEYKTEYYISKLKESFDSASEFITYLKSKSGATNPNTKDGGSL